MYEERKVFGEWFRLYFIENEGMAWGMKWGGDGGKLALTLFRLVAVVFGVYFIKKIIREKYHSGFIICAGLIFAGALGNLIDSMFYGLIFEESDFYAKNLAKMFPDKGYAGLFYGKVVDMFYFPIIRDAQYPDWFPVWGGQPFEFFKPVFNLADASISVGVITILFFQKRFFPQPPPASKTKESTKNAETEPDSLSRTSSIETKDNSNLSENVGNPPL